MTPLRCFIGWDKREAAAARVAARTLNARSTLQAEFLCIDRLRETGLLTRLADRRSEDGTYAHHDLISNAKASTDFAFSRFLTPILCQEGMALFTDCDVVFLRSPVQMLREILPGAAVYVVKHKYEAQETVKMDGQPQVAYPRKNWSSVILWDTDHPANRRLTLHDVNTRPGLWLHQFGWLADEEIGALDPAWNWLVNVQPMPRQPGIAHFTLGGPFTPGWKGAEHDNIWMDAAR
jgi:hypothetical protein